MLIVRSFQPREECVMTTKTYEGIVKFFNSKGKYGFLIVPELNTDDVFFHLSKQIEFYDGGREPVGKRRHIHRIPFQGEHTFFELTANAGKKRADPWGFVDEYEILRRAIELRNAP
jgi:hypothetical protein